MKAAGLSLLFSASLSASGLDTATIASSTLSPDCLEYRVVGICFWLYCSYGCRVRTSVKVRHYVPDAVVSSYANTGENPWSDVRGMSSPSGEAQGGGDGTTHQSHENNLSRFKNADVIGHPGSLIFSAFASGFGYSCSGAGTIFFPYLLSTLDTVAWRYNLPELAYRFRYRKEREYRMHNAAAGLLYHRILTSDILDWLTVSHAPWSALLYVLAGQYEHAGALGELVIQADQASVAQSLGGDPSRVLAAPPHSLPRKLLEGLRYLLKETLKLNQPQASDGWLKQDALWLMSGLLCVDTPPTAPTRFTEWAREHADTLGKKYASKLARRLDRTSAYGSN
jgi:hypothetical protein